MINKIILGVLLSAIIALSGMLFIEKTKGKSLENKNSDLEKAVIAYESLLKVKPFEAKNSEKKDNADGKIKDILDNNSTTGDGTYWM